MQAGDTVSSVAVMFGVSAETVARAPIYPCYQLGIRCSQPTDYTSDLDSIWAFSIGHVIYIPGAFSSTVPRLFELPKASMSQPLEFKG